MKQLAAMQATLELALRRGFDNIEFEQDGVNFAHLKYMYDSAEVGFHSKTFSDAKLGRYLGYIQGVLVATDTATLEEVKELNKEFSDDSDKKV